MVQLVSLILIRWIVIYPMDSAIQRLNNRGLIGALSRTIQQYSPLSEWIMCELGSFPIPLENGLLKVDKIQGLTIFLSKERLRRIQNSVFPFTVTEFCGRWIVYNSCLFA